MEAIKINEYKDPSDGQTIYSAKYDTTTYHSADRLKVEAWLKDKIDNADYYEQRKQETHRAMEIWYNSK